VLPLAEIDYAGFPPTCRTSCRTPQVDRDEPRLVVTNVIAARDLTSASRARIESVARGAFEALGLRRYGRVDVRIDAHASRFVIDVNATRRIAGRGLALAAARAGYAYTDVVAWIAESALRPASARDRR